MSKTVSIYESEVSCLYSILDLQLRCQNEKVLLSPDTNKYLLYLTLKKVGPSVAQKAISKLVANGELTWTEEEEFEVEQILDYVEEDGNEFYLIKWKGWSHAHNSWEPKENVDCQNLMDEFHTKNNKKNLPRAGSKRKFDEIKTFEDRETKRSRIDHLFQKLKSCKEGITPLKLISLTSPDKGKRSYRGVVSCEGLKVPKFNRITNVLNKRSKAFKLRQKEIQKALKDWEKHLNTVSTDPASIVVENNVDLEGPPENFVYINDYKPGEGIEIPNDPIIGCECTDCHNEKGSCCAAQFGVEYAYYYFKRLRIHVGRPIYECNKLCKCGPDCSNRVVQHGRKHKVCVFRTSNGRGWGVKALQKIKKGTFVMEYVGEVISNEEAEIRGKTYDSVGRTYLFDLDFNDGDCPFTVDAAVYGNVSHFVNHSCDPNLEVYSVWINTLDPRLPRIALFSRRDVEKGEELTFDYMSNKVHTHLEEVNHNETDQEVCTESEVNSDLITDANKMVEVISDNLDQLSNTESDLAINITDTESQETDSKGTNNSDLVHNKDSSTDTDHTDNIQNNTQDSLPTLVSENTEIDVKRYQPPKDVYRMVCQCGSKNCRKFVF